MKKTILCVDDEADIVELFSDEFKECGYRVLEARNGAVAYELFQNNRVDCILSDIRMPDMDGVELTKRVKEVGDIPIYLLTGFSDYSSDELNKLKVKAIIFKPFDLEEVVEMVRGALEAS